MIDLKKAVTVFIGRRDENHFHKLGFDVSSLLGDGYPGETLTAIYKRPDGTAYPCALRLPPGHYLPSIGHHRKGAGLLYLKRRAELYPYLEKLANRF